MFSNPRDKKAQQKLNAAMDKILNNQSTDNPNKIDLTEAVHKMEKEPEILLHVDTD